MNIQTSKYNTIVWYGTTIPKHTWTSAFIDGVCGSSDGSRESSQVDTRIGGYVINTSEFGLPNLRYFGDLNFFHF